jgi:hypothetical protein
MSILQVIVPEWLKPLIQSAPITLDKCSDLLYFLSQYHIADDTGGMEKFECTSFDGKPKAYFIVKTLKGRYRHSCKYKSGEYEGKDRRLD